MRLKRGNNLQSYLDRLLIPVCLAQSEGFRVTQGYAPFLWQIGIRSAELQSSLVLKEKTNPLLFSQDEDKGLVEKL